MEPAAVVFRDESLRDAITAACCLTDEEALVVGGEAPASFGGTLKSEVTPLSTSIQALTVKYEPPGVWCGQQRDPYEYEYCWYATPAWQRDDQFVRTD